MPQYPRKKRSPQKDRMVAESEGKRVVFKKFKTRWPINRTGFKDLRKIDQQRYLSAIKKLKRKFPKEKLRVLDWGCGQGRMVSNLATMFPEIEVIGFSKEASSADWEIAPKNAKFLHTTKEVLERHMQREKRKGKNIHLVVSNFGLEHLGLNELTSHLAELSNSLPVGAEIITNPLLFYASKNSRQETLLKKAIEQIEAAGYKIKFSSRRSGEVRYLESLQKVK